MVRPKMTQRVDALEAVAMPSTGRSDADIEEEARLWIAALYDLQVTNDLIDDGGPSMSAEEFNAILTCAYDKIYI